MGVLKYQQTEDSLHPGRAALGGGRDDNVVRPRCVAFPPATVTRPESVFMQCGSNQHASKVNLVAAAFNVEL